jgi:DNA-binding response OmpR family regulator
MVLQHNRSCNTSFLEHLYGKLESKELLFSGGQSMADETKRLVYIEDEIEMIDLVRLILGRKGFEVVGANGGQEGLELVRNQPPDLVLLDLMMPDLDGWEVFQQLKADEATRQIPVIVVTAKAQTIDRVLGLHIAKVDDYISKPFSPQELISSVEKVLDKKYTSAETTS